MHRIRPFPKILTANEKHCCINGKTPTEYTREDPQPTEITETVVDNGDGTHTTTWQTPSAITNGRWTIEFNICCVDHLVLTSTGDPGCDNPAEGFVDWELSINGIVILFDPSNSEGCDGYTHKVLEDLPDVPVGTFPLGPCGAHIRIDGHGLWTISITYGKEPVP